MPFTPIPASAIDATPEVSRSAFGHPVRLNLDDLDSRVAALVASYTGLDGRTSALESLTANTSTNGGQGNARLADRLGTGVGTGTNTTPGNAAAQLGDLRTRATNLETRTTNLEGIAGGKWRNATTDTIAQNARIPFPTTMKTPSGVTVSDSNRNFTPVAGNYDINASVHGNCPTAGSLWVIITTSAADGTVNTPWLGGNVIPVNAGFYCAQATAPDIDLNGSTAISVYVWYSQGGLALVETARQATWLSIRRRKN